MLLQAGVRQGARPLITVISGSMRPLLAPGDQVEVAFCPPELLHPGEIVVVRNGVELLTHRYLATFRHAGHSWLVTRGDRPISADPPWHSDALVGRVTCRVRRGRALHLDSGRGQTLHRLLGRIALAEGQWLGGPATAAWQQAHLTHPAHAPRLPRWYRSRIGRKTVLFLRKPLLALTSLLALILA
jgi:hypothetical protein